MKQGQQIACVIASAAWLAVTGLQAQDVTPPPAVDLKPYQVPAPKGEYRVVELTLEPGGIAMKQVGPNDVRPGVLDRQVVRLAFRDSKMVNFWLVPVPWTHSRAAASTVELDDKGLRGEQMIRFYDEKATELRDEWRITLDMKRDAAGSFAGSVSISNRLAVKDVAMPLTGKATGKLVGGAESLAKGADWPAMGGPTRTMAAAYSGALVDDLANALPVWRSERTVPVSFGNAADGRYPQRAIGARLCGGSSSPVVQDGVVYQGFYEPSKQTPVQVPDWALADKYKLGKPIDELAVERQLTPEEKTALEDFYRPLADEHVVAMDAATGKTLWETVWPQRVWSVQGHKYRGGHGVPLVAGGKVFYPTLHGHLKVMDAVTGTPLWEKPEKYTAPNANWAKYSPSPCQSPLLFGDTVVWFGSEGSAEGLSAADGKQKWQAKDLGLRAIREFVLDGKPHVLACGGVVALIDPADGREVWRATESVGSSHDQQFTCPSDVIVAGDRLVVCDAALEDGKIKKGFVRVRGWKITATGLAEPWTTEDIRKDENAFMTVADGRVYLTTGDVRVFDLATGKPAGTFDRYPGPVGSNAGMVIVGNKGLLWPEGQHGSQGYATYRLEPNGGALTSATNRPSYMMHPATSSYSGQPLVPAVADGRFFVRGGDGIYCYDLRAASKPGADGRAKP
jgi:outer membrane protein assembly factor BamB